MEIQAVNLYLNKDKKWGISICKLLFNNNPRAFFELIYQHEFEYLRKWSIQILWYKIVLTIT